MGSTATFLVNSMGLAIDIFTQRCDALSLIWLRARWGDPVKHYCAGVKTLRVGGEAWSLELEFCVGRAMMQLPNGSLGCALQQWPKPSQGGTGMFNFSADSRTTQVLAIFDTGTTGVSMTPGFISTCVVSRGVESSIARA